MTCHFLLYLQRQRPPQPQDTHTHTHPWPFTSVGPVFSLGYECVLNGFQLFMTHVDWAPPGDLPDPGIKPTSPVSPALQEDS